jgi:hypothetical protein
VAQGDKPTSASHQIGFDLPASAARCVGDGEGTREREAVASKGLVGVPLGVSHVHCV